MSTQDGDSLVNQVSKFSGKGLMVIPEEVETMIEEPAHANHRHYVIEDMAQTQVAISFF